MRVTRRLAAILALDVVGYGRLMEKDEAGTLAVLRDRRKTILDSLVTRHRGRIVKVMGDGALVEFASAVGAVECGVELQSRMTDANAGLPDDRAIVLRVGINLGEVMVEDGDLYGDGVNIAARLEAIAEPGGICVSSKVHDEVRGKLDLGFDDLGEIALKNMSKPVRVYRVAGRPHVLVATPPAMSDKPAIAVLPFVNMSGDPEQQYFSDGITEDIITELSRFRSHTVIARNSSFQYRDKSADVRRIGRDLGAEYVVEGSVRRVGNHIRVTAQLIEAASGNHLWAERYDRELEDIFVVQDEIVRTIVGALPGRIMEAGARSAGRKRPENLAAYDYLLRGIAQWLSFYIVASYGQLGRLEEARGQIAECRSLHPGVKLLQHAAHEPYKEQADLDHLLDGLRKAGLTE
jgi:adenylate cyclase